MLIKKHTVETNAPASAIWQLWEDVESWPTWAPVLEFSKLDGPFRTGTTGTLKPRGAPALNTKLVDVNPMKSFVIEGKFTLAKVVVTHSMDEIDGNRRVTHQIEMKGPLAFIFAYIVGREMKKCLPQEMMALVRKAENITYNEKRSTSLEKGFTIRRT